MKLYKNSFLYLLLGLLALLTVSCLEDSDGSPDVEPGNPVLSRVTPEASAVGVVITVEGSGLGDIRSIVFDKNDTPAGVVSTLNTENAIIFHVPDDAEVGLQNIILTNSEGRSLTVPFEVLGFANITSASNYNFTADGELTLYGKNLGNVELVTFAGTTEEIEVVSMSETQLVLKFPSTEIARAKLDITNKAGLSTTSMEFINKDKAFVIFDDNYQNGFENGSWGDGIVISTDEVKVGSASAGKTYAKGNWHLTGFVNWWPGAADDGYKYISFWVKGASVNYELYITSDKGEGGYGDYIEANKFTVPANVWTYYKISLTDVKLWADGGAINQLGFRIKGPDSQDETFYFDDLILVK